MPELRVSRIQHTSFRIESAKTSVVVDPAIDYFNDMWSRHGDSSRAIALLDSPHAVLITHSHTDHFHPPTLMHLDRVTRVVVPREVHAALTMCDELRRLGFTNMLEVDPGDLITVGDLEVTVVDSPDSIEGIPQLSYVVEHGPLRVLLAADALEGFGARAEVDLHGLDLALLPLNVSLNANNLRNQMSPATFFQTLDELEPCAVVPLGTNEGERRPFSPVSAPWFPFSDAHLASTAFDALRGDFPIFLVKDGEGVRLQPGATPGASTAQAVPRPEPQRRVAEVALGRLRALLYDLHSRSRTDFFLDAALSFEKWRSRWLENLGSLLSALGDGGALVDEVVSAIPVLRSASPVATVFRSSLGQAEAAHPGTHARALWCLSENVGELAFVQQCYDIICGELPDDRWRWRATIEYAAWLQGRHLATRPPDPRAWTEHDRRSWWTRQIESDVRAAHFVFPNFNPVFGPFVVADEWSFLGLRRADNGVTRVVRHLVPEEHTEWVIAILDSSGRRSLSALLAEHGDGGTAYSRFCRWLTEREPYAIDTHWLPGHRWSWTPSFDSHFTRRTSRVN